jgi:4-hydroxy-tetrahydrodipicolinate synthase
LPKLANFRSITPEVFSRLMEIDNIQYIKDSTASVVRIQQLVATGGKVFNGGDPIAFQALLAGCVGCIWGAINAMPKQAVELYRLTVAGKLTEANALWKRMLPAQLFFWEHEYNPSIKAAVNIAGHQVGDCRKPLQPLGQSAAATLRSAMEQLSAPRALAAE